MVSRDMRGWLGATGGRSPDDSASDSGDEVGRCDVRNRRPSRVNWIDSPW